MSFVSTYFKRIIFKTVRKKRRLKSENPKKLLASLPFFLIYCAPVCKLAIIFLSTSIILKINDSQCEVSNIPKTL